MALICRANRSRRNRPKTIPSGTHDGPGSDGDAGLPSDDGHKLASGAPEGLEESQISPVTAHRRKQRQSQGGNRPGRPGRDRVTPGWSPDKRAIARREFPRGTYGA
jgi:hypothetical protein